MSNIVIRQNDLFLGEDWKVIYTAFNNISFKNYSYTSIKQSLIEYIRVNYPEDFTDWTENSEFMIIIDLLAYLAESMSYRIDLNARDNFIDTAERRESILRLAKMISYSPKRNFPARGKVKLRYVKTSQIVLDSEGRNLQNKMIEWNDPQNPDWYEQFLLVINASLISSNPFGRPIKQVKTSNGNIQLYRVNSTTNDDLTLSFSTTVAGEAMNFEVINVDVDNFGNFYERSPDPFEAKHMIYMNDGSGNSSANTGFFLYFKQGSLDYQDYNFDVPIENRVEDLDIENINEMDVWVSKINESGMVLEQWEKVPTIENIAYNSIDREIRNIYTVQSKNLDMISVRFSDGKFGTVPRGIFRIWYRVSNGLEYTINPMEMSGRSVTLSYRNNSGVDQDSTYDLYVIFDLHDVIRNSSSSEENEQIKTNAPRVYYTQNRMTNGEDYNSLPLSYGTQVVKLKAVNRVFSGQSPYFNNYDVTKRYSSTVEFGDDGIIYKDDYNANSGESLPTNLTPLQIINTHIVPLLQKVDLYNFFLDRNNSVDISNYEWKKVSGQKSISTGYFLYNNVNVQIGPSETYPNNVFAERGFVKFEKPVSSDPGYFPESKWVNILNISNEGLYDPSQDIGPIVIDEYIPDGWLATKVIPTFRQTLTQAEINSIVDQIENQNTFGLRYDFILNRWIVIDELNVSPASSTWSPQYTGDNSDANRDASWYIRAEYSTNEYRFLVRLMRYVFESENVSRFFFNEDFSGINQLINRVNKSQVTILKLNQNLHTNGLFDKDMKFTVINNIKYADGYIDPRRVQIVPYDSDADGVVDDPEIFKEIVNMSLDNHYVFFVKSLDSYGFEEFIPTDDILFGTTPASLNFYDWTNNPNGYLAGFSSITGLFYEWDNVSTTLKPVMEKYRSYTGRGKLNFKNEHFSPENNRIDPAITNVIDMYVLTKSYDKIVKEWKNGTRTSVFPEPELSAVLQDSFSGMDEYKMISDQMVWNPAKFTLLFGTMAEPELQAIFKVVKIDTTPLTDNQIKQGILNAIDEYFDLSNWSFGESIYTSELMAYIHKQMINHIASIVIVPKMKNEFGIRHPGDIYQIRMDFDHLPLNVATVDDITIIPTASKYNIVS